MTKATDAKNTARDSFANGTKAVTDLFGAFYHSGRKSVEGVIAVDKALLGYAKDTVSGTYDAARKSMGAKDINELIDIQASYAHRYIEASATNAREAIDLARMKALDAYAPLKDAFGALYPAKKSA